MVDNHASDHVSSFDKTPDGFSNTKSMTGNFTCLYLRVAIRVQTRFS